MFDCLEDPHFSLFAVVVVAKENPGNHNPAAQENLVFTFFFLTFAPNMNRTYNFFALKMTLIPLNLRSEFISNRLSTYWKSLPLYVHNTKEWRSIADSGTSSGQR